jgi:uncharacterized protein YmfQ (DUF2313 family)
MDKFAQALSYLLPTGFAWPRDPNSVLMRVLRGLAGSLAELHLWSNLTVRHWQPATTTRLAEWEAACGLPDACLGADQSEALRRSLLLARLRGPERAYHDSSPAALGAIEQLCLVLGYTVTLSYRYPFRVGTHRVGDRLGRLNGRLLVAVQGLVRTPMRVGVGRVGEPLARYNIPVEQLECYLQRLLPARFSVNFVIY